MKETLIIVGMVNSIHLARWVEHLYKFKKIETYIFPVFPAEPHDLLKKMSSIVDKKSNIHTIKLSSNYKFNLYLQKFLYLIFQKNFYLIWLKKSILRIKPKYIHSHELTTSSILCLSLKNILKEKFPKWIVSNWGSELYYFYKFKKFKKKLNQILKLANFYSAECNRDYILANKIGSNAKFLPCVLNSGGIKIKKLKKGKFLKTSLRKVIVVKGYQGLIGLGLFAIKALEKISNQIKDYKIIVYSADKEVIEYYYRIKNKAKLNIKLYSSKEKLNENQMYEIFSNSRIYIGISRSDGVSTSFLEAMALGTFPIQSATSCANEWIKNAKSGFLVKNNITHISKKILKAIKNDYLVDNASKINLNIIKKKANSNNIKIIVRNFYK
jgi:glycosyltransferase involved in cell wall biosynthesis